MEFVKGKDFAFKNTKNGFYGIAIVDTRGSRYSFLVRETESSGEVRSTILDGRHVEVVEQEFCEGLFEIISDEKWAFITALDEIAERIGIPAKDFLLDKRLQRENVSSIEELSRVQLGVGAFHFERKLRSLEEMLKK